MRTLMVMTRLLFVPAAITVTSCGRSAPRPPNPMSNETAVVALDDWVGVYASPSEIAGFSRTVLMLEKDDRGGLSYRMTQHSDRGSTNLIEQNELSGACITSSSTLFLPIAHGYYDNEKKPQLSASIDRYMMETINGRRILMRDDALAAYRRDNKLYDYGIVIRTDHKPAWELDLKVVEAPSIKLLYQDSAKPWHDPFVHGPNER